MWQQGRMWNSRKVTFLIRVYDGHVIIQWKASEVPLGNSQSSRKTFFEINQSSVLIESPHIRVSTWRHVKYRRQTINKISFFPAENLFIILNAGNFPRKHYKTPTRYFKLLMNRLNCPCQKEHGQLALYLASVGKEVTCNKSHS